MSSERLLKTLSELSYGFTVLITLVAAGLSCAAIISQAVRTSESQSWVGNFNALIIGGSYIILVRPRFRYGPIHSAE